MSLSTPDIIVAGVALLLIAYVASMGRRPRIRGPARGPSPYQDIFMAIGEVEPAPPTVVLRRGTPAKLRVHCDAAEVEELVIETLHISRKLPLHKTSTIDVPTDEAGAHRLSSGNGRWLGTIVIVS